MSVVGSFLDGTVASVLDAAGHWVADGAVWLLGQAGHAMTAASSVDLGAGWFTSHERVMAVLSAGLVLPMACCAAMLAVYRQDASMLLRTFFVHLPLALAFTGVAVELVRLAMAATDQLSAQVLKAGSVDTEHLLAPVGSALAATSGAGLPSFVLLLGALLVALAALMLWLELVVRSAAITAATLFLPLALAGLVWPAVSHWARRLADTIAALVLSKLVVAAVLSLAAGAIAHGAGFGTVVVGIALLVVATTAPFTLLRLVPAIEAGAVLHLETARHRLRHAASAPLRATNFAMDIAGGSGMLGSGDAPSAGAALASGIGSGAMAMSANGAVSGDGAIPMMEGMSPEEAWNATGLWFGDPASAPDRRATAAGAAPPHSASTDDGAHGSRRSIAGGGDRGR